MEQEKADILEPLLFDGMPKRRRMLLPVWVKVFVWLFLVMGAIIPLALVAGIAGGNFSMSLYGLSTTEPLSVLGLLLCVYLFKGIVALGLWTEQAWAVDLALADAVIGIVICAAVMLVLPFLSGYEFAVRLELIALIPYLLLMQRIRNRWISAETRRH